METYLVTTEDARLLAARKPRIDGRAGIEGFRKQAVDSGFTNMNLQTKDVSEAGDLAIEIGGRTSTAGPGDAGNYVMVWRRESGVLKIDVDIFNSGSGPDSDHRRQATARALIISGKRRAPARPAVKQRARRDPQQKGDANVRIP